MTNAEVLDRDALTIDDASGSAGSPASAVGTGDLDLRRNLERVERELIGRALRVAEGNRAQAARLLGIRRALLCARMHQLGLDKRPARDAGA